MPCHSRARAIFSFHSFQKLNQLASLTISLAISRVKHAQKVSSSSCGIMDNYEPSTIFPRLPSASTYRPGKSQEPASRSQRRNEVSRRAHARFGLAPRECFPQPYEICTRPGLGGYTRRRPFSTPLPKREISISIISRNYNFYIDIPRQSW
jgi:hypothetical protein